MIEGTTITGANLIASKWSRRGFKILRSINPVDGSHEETEFAEAIVEEIEVATKAAADAVNDPRFQDIQIRSDFLEEMAHQIELLGEELIEAACFETGLPRPRIQGEKARTIFQIRSFAESIKRGEFLGLSIDRAIPDRAPLPKPDIRKKNIPIGPVAVFSAGNFPLAFSTAGGDTVSAIAAGCPVILKGHDGHLMTNEIIAGAILKAIKESEMPNGIFSFLNGGYDIGKALVMDTRVKSVAFTGSFNGGKALMEYANQREDPIPVFCEMGSINPVLISSKYQEHKGEELASQISDSVFLGTGQFCTNPGILIVQKGDFTEDFLARIKELLLSKEPTPMLNSRIFKGFSEKIQNLSEPIPEKENHSRGYIKTINVREYLGNKRYGEEIFGPFTLAVIFENEIELEQIISDLNGQLTASIFFLDEEWLVFKSILAKMEQKVGRMIFRSLPTGVEVCPSMQHGGPWPASSDPRFTSVGIDAINRFLRPVSFQGYPDAELPIELQNKNLSQYSRRIEGKTSK